MTTGGGLTKQDTVSAGFPSAANYDKNSSFNLNTGGGPTTIGEPGVIQKSSHHSSFQAAPGHMITPGAPPIMSSQKRSYGSKMASDGPLNQRLIPPRVQINPVPMIMGGYGGGLNTGGHPYQQGEPEDPEELAMSIELNRLLGESVKATR
eukprot:UN24236